jgi:flagellar biosynthesis/type III secretory pathway protein FliH
MNQSAQTLEVEPYDYATATAAPGVCEDWVLAEVDVEGNPLGTRRDCASDIVSNPGLLEEQFQGRVAEEARRSFEAGYEQGRQDGVAAERGAEQAARTEKLQRLAAAVGTIAEDFAGERGRYYEQLEQEAVKLALAMAGRILRREAQMDPLFLLGAVRVALGQLTDSTKVRLRVPAADAELWIEAMALLPNRDTRPEVIAAEGIEVGQCVMETELGSADLGVRAQLGEMERSMFDRSSETLRAEPAAVRR